MNYRKSINIMYNQETRLALLELSMTHINDTLNEMRKENKEEFKEIKKELKEVKKNSYSNFKWVISIIFGSQIFSLSVAVVAKVYNLI